MKVNPEIVEGSVLIGWKNRLHLRKRFYCQFFIMLSRRILRIKILQSLYAYNKAAEESLKNAEKNLFLSIR